MNYYYLLLFITVYFWFCIFFIVYTKNYLRVFSYFFFCLFLIFCLCLAALQNKFILYYQFILQYYQLSFFNINYIFGFDCLSISLLLLCSFLLTICFFSYWHLRYKINIYSFILFCSLWILLNIFFVLDFLVFYIFFEAIVIPMFFLIGIWGSRARKVYAAYLLFLYTLFGSVFILICFLSIYLNKGSSAFDFFLFSKFFEKREFCFWILLFIGFSVKIPLMPFHIWLPEAHVEAPTPGSVILAGIVLKLGVYAIFRLLLGPFFNIYYDLIFFILSLCLLSFLYSSFIALNQIDIKKIIAYSSIAHMNFSLLGIFSYNLMGLFGAFFLMFGHAVTSSALFLGIGVLYDRYKTRLIFYYGSLITFMPIFGFLYFIFLLSNFGFPGTFNFVGEIFIITGGFYVSCFITIFTTIGSVLSLVYSLFLYNKIFFGPLNKIFIRFYNDITRIEFFIFIILLFLVLFFGVSPQTCMDFSIFFFNKLFISI